MIDHGGNLDVARARFGGRREDWIDLSTGINRSPFPVPDLPAHCWTELPSRAEVEALLAVAGSAYQTKAAILATAGAQAAIQMLPHLVPPGRARILAPTYGEFSHVLRGAGWTVEMVADLDALTGADLAVVVNPNNPDGQRHDPQALLSLASRVGRLVVDESFADVTPELSLAEHAGQERLLVLRSFGKFYGLAGLRLGFVLGSAADIAALSAISGPWPVSGVAIEIGRVALSDAAWADEMRARLVRDAARLDALAQAAGFALVGGTPLFRLYDVGDGLRVEERLAGAQIWSRVFGDRPTWLRLGLPGDEAEWQRVAAALSR